MPDNRTSDLVRQFLRIGEDMGEEGMLDQVLRKYERLEAAIREVLADSESVDSGWGPDVTMRGVLKQAIAYDPVGPDEVTW